MAEHHFGNIKVPKRFVNENFKKVVAVYYKQSIYNESWDCRTETDSLAEFEDDNAENGEMKLIEEYCSVNNIPYDLYASKEWEYEAQSRYWRPGMDHPHIVYHNHDGDEYIPIVEFRKLTELLLDDCSKEEAIIQAGALLKSHGSGWITALEKYNEIKTMKENDDD